MTKEKQEYPPLVTDRSPSIERARWEHEHPSPATDPELIARLNRLVEAEHNAAALFDAAMDNMTHDPGLAEEIAAMAGLHEGYARTLADVVSGLGGAAPRAEDCTQVLSRSPGDLAYVQSADELLAALAATQDELGARYDGTAGYPGISGDVAETLARLTTAARQMRARIASHTHGQTRF